MKKWLGYAVPALMMASLSGCFISSDDDDDPEVPYGTLTVKWTIDGARIADDCAAFGVDRMEFLLYAGGDLIDEFEPLCESFALSVDLPEGIYDGDATLVDSFDRSATDTHEVDAIDIVGDTELVIDVDFPVGSFVL
jgi:hypothetical protein